MPGVRLVPVLSSVAIMLGGVSLASCGDSVSVSAVNDAAPRQQVDAFFSALAKNDYAAAYALLASEPRAQTTEAEFADKFDAAERAGNGIASARVEPAKELTQDAALHVASVTFDNGKQVDFDIPVVLENSEWRVYFKP